MDKTLRHLRRILVPSLALAVGIAPAALAVPAPSGQFAISPPAAATETLPEPSEFEADSDEPRVAPFVLNGDPVANPGWVASILWNGNFNCTGSLIHSEWVLTAAHCVEDADSTYSVNIGANQWYGGTIREISEVFIHPGYVPSTIESVDLAMVKLSAPVVASSLPKLSGFPSWPSLDQSLVVVGWGQTFTGSPPADTLQAGGVRVDSDSLGTVHEDYCYRPWVSASGYEDFCFGGSSSACPGDSGGPLLGYSSPSVTTGAIDTIYGVTSFGQDIGCSDTWLDSVAQRVGTHIAWINGLLPPPEDGTDEQFFYRASDGLFVYYDVSSSGALTSLLGSGKYSSGWSSIMAIDLDG